VGTDVEEEHTKSLFSLFENLVKNLFFESLFDCIKRFDEGKPEESKCLHDCLEIVETLIEIKPLYCKVIVDRTK
jgi:hypothetical protein